MKRLIALLLLAATLLAALPALGADYTLDEKLFKQVKDGSGLRITIKTQKSGGDFSLLSPEDNALLRTLLPGAELSIRYLRGVGVLKGQEEMELVLTKNGQAIGEMRLLKDSQFEQLTSAFFGAVRYVDRRDGGALMALLSGEDPTWPPVEGVLLKLNTAESTWQGEVARKLDAYSLKLTLWLQAFTQSQNQYDAQNNPQTRIIITVPASQLKAQIKQLLVDAYNDTELLALLAREMDARQVAAYLQPSMRDSFFQSLDRLPLTGDMVSERLLNAQGQVVENKLILPLGGARGLNRVLYTHSLRPEGEQTVITLEYAPRNAQNQKGAVTSLVFSGGPVANSHEITYAGTISLQPEAGGDAFTVDATEGDPPARVYRFSLRYAPAPEVVDQAAGSSTRDIGFTLQVTPQGDTDVKAQLVTGSVNLRSRLNSRSATYFTGFVTWQDEGTQAQVHADITGNTAAPWTIPAVDANGAVRVDGLSTQQLATLSQQVQTILLNALTSAMLRQMMPTESPAP